MNKHDPILAEGELLEKFDYAFQPILNIQTGSCLGVEALLRGTAEAGYPSIQSFFNEMQAQNRLLPVEMQLRAKAIRKFKSWPHSRQTKLFFNSDSRLFKHVADHPQRTLEILEALEVHPSDFCIEISELHDIGFNDLTKAALDGYRDLKIKIAIDDFGAGFSCFRMLYHSEPDFIKVDRFFITDIFRDPRKKLFVSKLINLARILGITVIAEGVETREEFFVCRELGCDYFQGFLAQRPTTALDELQPVYPAITALTREDRRRKLEDQDFIRRQMVVIEPILTSARSVADTLSIFKRNEADSFFPVLNETREPLGIIRERDLKRFIYSMYGWQILSNMGIERILKDYVAKCTVAEISTPIETITELFTSEGQEQAEGILVTENGKYIGFLNALSLLKVLNDKNIMAARDQNPLTGLPGNNMIQDYIARTLGDGQEDCLLVYFDFNHFKPFNDKYGFRLGDRAILLFADILRKNIVQSGLGFVGHVGGDDFICGLRVDDSRLPHLLETIRFIQDKFREDVRLLYSDEDRQAGLGQSLSRANDLQRFELMTVSAAVLHLRLPDPGLTPEAVSVRITNQKRDAKRSASYYLYAVI